jgi:hypothetical protein
VAHQLFEGAAIVQTHIRIDDLLDCGWHQPFPVAPARVRQRELLATHPE